MDLHEPIIKGITTSDSSYTGTAFIKTSGTSAQFLIADGSVKIFGTTIGTVAQGNDSRFTDARVASDVYAWAKASVKPTYTYTEVGAAASAHTHSYEPVIAVGTTAQYWRGDKSWQTLPTYTHPTGDGNLHVPATGTTNNGKVLTAGATAGSLSWVTPSTGGTGTIDQVLAAGNTAVSKQLIFTQSGYTTTINSTSYKLVADSINYGIELDNNGIIFTMNTATQNYSSIVSESVSVSGKLPLLGFIAPGSASATGVQGEIRITSTYVYFCIGLNSWVRGAMSSW